MSVHAASFAGNDGATLMLAPSGTGKTLTVLNWLCRGNQFYGDDQACIYNGYVLPLVNSVSYWEHRYKGNNNALPDTMPGLQSRERKQLRIAKLLKFLSLGNVGFGTSLDPKEYWPNSIAEIKPVTKILMLQKADKFGIIKNASREEAVNKIMGDFRFQSLSILRWAECARLTRKNLFLTEWENKCKIELSTL